jgi:hypothetical protein
MRSPFPGMDPYLEAPRRWLEFHNHLAAEICAVLNRTLEPRYVASLTSSIAYQAVEITPPRVIQPDLAVLRSTTAQEEASSGLATLAPMPVESSIPWEVPLALYRVEILTIEEEELVTVIEILSPSNKRRGHEDCREYQRKRRDLCRSSAHLMEIDLLRGGERPPLEEPVPDAPYYVLVSRAEQRPRVRVWPMQLPDPLPTVPVPVQEPDPDVPLDLQAALTSAYERGAFARKIDYQRPPPPPPLPAEVSAWVESVLHRRPPHSGETGGEH